MKAEDIEKVWEFLGGKDAEQKDDSGRIYLWPTLGSIYKDELVRELGDAKQR